MVENQENVQIEELQEYDINKMSDRKLGDPFEKPPKVELDGQEVEITKVSIKPTLEDTLTKNGKKKRKVIFSLEFDGEHIEYYGGVSVFVYDDGNIGEPTIWAEGNRSASAKLFNKWLEFKGKKMEETNYKEFFSSLRGMKVKISTVDSPYDGQNFRKNVVVEFVGGNSPSSTQSTNKEESTLRSKVLDSHEHLTIDTAGDIPPQPTRPETVTYNMDGDAEMGQWVTPKEV